MDMVDIVMTSEVGFMRVRQCDEACCAQHAMEDGLLLFGSCFGRTGTGIGRTGIGVGIRSCVGSLVLVVWIGMTLVMSLSIVLPVVAICDATNSFLFMH
jgi:hypothetical protein